MGYETCPRNTKQVIKQNEATIRAYAKEVAKLRLLVADLQARMARGVCVIPR